MDDQGTYGFSKDDAESLLPLIGSVETEIPERIPGGSTVRLYRFTLNESLADGTADADIIEMDGTDTGIDDTVRDPEGIFVDLTSVGDSGLCIFQDGKYYVIQAPCP